MKKNNSYQRKSVLALLGVLLLWTSCSTEKDGLVYRTFHNTTARYNGYFYAGESMREAQMILNEEKKDDYDKILPVFVYGDEQASQAVFPQMERIIEKTSLVIEKHDMDIPKRGAKKMKRPEMNKWIDNNWMLMGQAYFIKQNYFKAEEIFRFVVRKYEDENIQATAHAWLGRVYLEREDWIKANNNLIKAASMKKDIDQEVRADVLLVYADYHIRQGQYKEAVEKLEEAIGLIKRKKNKARPTFILAQLYQELNKSQDAIDTYRLVTKLRPEYEMEFYAQINQALAFNRRGGNPEEIKAKLMKMLKDDKNIEYRDQIYYALADMSLEQRNKPEALDYLQASLDANTDNVKQKAKTYLKLADIQLEDRIYDDAQAYYDSTYQNIQEDHPRFKEIENLAQSLTELVTSLNIIEREDSLQAFCSLSDSELEKRLKEVQKQIEREIEEERLRQEELLAQQQQEGLPTGAGTGMFWAYNNTLRSSGYAYFKDFWGDRPLEDNWRRRNKLSTAFDSGDDPEEEEVVEEVASAKSGQDEVPTIDELMADLPCDNVKMDASNAAIAEARYNAGLLYKEKLDDESNAIEQWEVLVTEYENSDFHPTAYYQLYRTYLAKENEGYTNLGCGNCSSAYWAGEISKKYPGSEWEKLVMNPDYKDFKEIKEAEERAVYEALYQEYYYRQYVSVIQKAGEIIASEPENHLLCKYRMLKAQSIGHMDAITSQTENYVQALTDVVQSCPGSEEAEFAQTALNYISGEIAAPVEEIVEEKEPEPMVSDLFTYDEKAMHYFAVVFPLDRGDANRIKATIADFNTAYFKSMALRTTSNLLGKEHQIVMVKSFRKFDEAQSYYSTFIHNDGELKDLNAAGYDTFLISKDNYLELFKSREIEAYMEFFKSNYE
ncbi:MAG: tetratricopeptide repeat protein [Flavobacteriales bacterium]|nr:tetratricopeptide repeat protein [Flavobacteriales bacterium]